MCLVDAGSLHASLQKLQDSPCLHHPKRSLLCNASAAAGRVIQTHELPATTNKKLQHLFSRVSKEKFEQKWFEPKWLRTRMKVERRGRTGATREAVLPQALRPHKGSPRSLHLWENPGHHGNVSQHVTPPRQPARTPQGSQSSGSRVSGLALVATAGHDGSNPRTLAIAAASLK